MYTANLSALCVNHQWNAPEKTWGSRITGYRIMWRIEGSSKDFGADACAEEFAMRELTLVRGRWR